MQAEIRRNMSKSKSSDDDENANVAQYRITPVEQAAASCSGAVMTSLFVTPLDVVKTRLQAQQRASYSAGHQRFIGTVDAFIGIGRNEGIRALWSGLTPTLILALPATILYFVTYEQLRIRIKDYYNLKEGITNEKYQTQPFWVPMVSGASARVFAVSCISPLELIKTKMQSEKLSYYQIKNALEVLLRRSGIRGLWKGITPTLCRDVPFSAVYWTSYEGIKRFFNKETAAFPLSFIAGAISGGMAATITTPFDVVKTYQQIGFGSQNGEEPHQEPKNMREIIKRILKRHGIKGLYAGLVPRLMKVAPACAIMISSFEYGKVFFSQRSHKGKKAGRYYDYRYDTVLDFSLDEFPVVVVDKETSNKDGNKDK